MAARKPAARKTAKPQISSDVRNARLKNAALALAEWAGNTRLVVEPYRQGGITIRTGDIVEHYTYEGNDLLVYTLVRETHGKNRGKVVETLYDAEPSEPLLRIISSVDDYVQDTLEELEDRRKEIGVMDVRKDF